MPAQCSDMVFIQGGTFWMGSERFYPEEAPRRRVQVSSFLIDRHPVTNADFARFVAASGYVTLAEKALDPANYPGLDANLLEAGSLVFEPTAGPVDLSDFTQWWDFRAGACWSRPLGPGSSIDGLHDHPVVHIGWHDARAYAAWAGKALPTEAEWEFAARGGLDGAEFAWGDQLAPEGTLLANFWQGPFPYLNALLDGWERTSPVGAFPPNGYGLCDMIGNVWEWTDDWYAEHRATASRKASCCIPCDPRGGAESDSADPASPYTGVGRKVTKGGSHLCAPNYCQRYRPAARHPQSIDSTAGHLGFRCVRRTFIDVDRSGYGSA